MFFIFTFLVGIVCVVVPLWLLRFAGQKWQVPRKIFWKAGIAGIVVSALVFAVTLNIDGAFPNFDALPDLAQALILGFLNGLFMELGKFLVLDRLIKVRDRHNGFVFGMGWSGLGIIVMGFFLAFGVFGMQNLVNTKDIASTVPNIDADQLQFLQESQKQIQTLVNGSPLKAFTPLLENIGLFLLDIALTLFMILGIRKGQTRNVWFAVLIRTVLSASVLYVGQINVFPVEIIFIGWILVAGGFLWKVYSSFTAS